MMQIGFIVMYKVYVLRDVTVMTCWIGASDYILTYCGRCLAQIYTRPPTVLAS